MAGYVSDLRNCVHKLDGCLLVVDIICDYIPDVIQFCNVVTEFDRAAHITLTADNQGNCRVRMIFTNQRVDPEMVELVLSDRECAAQYFSIPELSVV